MINGLEVSVARQLSATHFEEQVQQLTREEAQHLLIQFHQQVQRQESQTKTLLAKIADLMEALA